MGIKKVFLNRNTHTQANTNYKLKITINNNNKDEIEGYMVNKFATILDANWDTIFNMDGKLSGIRNVLGAAGIQLFSSGIFTRKFYKGGSYLNIAPEFRIVDWDGKQFQNKNGGVENIVLHQTKKLLRLTTPSGAVDRNKTVPSEEKSNSDGINFSGQSFGQVTTLAKKLAKKSLAGLASFSPPSCVLEVGNYFILNDMIVNNVKVEYSKEMTDFGPLFADCSVSFSTAEVVRTGTVERAFNMRKSRVQEE